MTPIESFKDLLVWQRAIQLSVSLYKLTQDFPGDERFGLTNQLRRAGVSVASNIAEGYLPRLDRGIQTFSRNGTWLKLRGQTQLTISAELGFGNPEHLGETDRLAQEVGKMLTSLMQKLPR